MWFEKYIKFSRYCDILEPTLHYTFRILITMKLSIHFNSHIVLICINIPPLLYPSPTEDIGLFLIHYNNEECCHEHSDMFSGAPCENFLGHIPRIGSNCIIAHISFQLNYILSNGLLKLLRQLFFPITEYECFHFSLILPTLTIVRICNFLLV